MAKIDSWTSGVGGDTGAQIKTKLLEAQKSVETEGTYIEGDGNVGTPVDLTTAAKTSLGKADSAVQPTATQTLTNKTIIDYTNTVHADAVHARAKATENILKGQAVVITGYNTGEAALEIALADNTTGVATGIAYENISTGNFGLIISAGILENVDTSAFSEGVILYVNGSGNLTPTEPSTGFAQPIAYVLRSNANSGALQILADYPKQDAADVRYSNSTSGLTATDVQAAIDEVKTLAAGGGYTDADAQDAVGSILTDTAEIDFVYDNILKTIIANIKTGSIDESKLDTSVNASLDKADSALQSSAIGVTVQAYSAILAATTAAFTTALLSKLNGIEANADVTDNDNVRSAGALMDDEVTNLADVKAFDPANFATAAQGTKADSALQDLVDDTTPQLGGDLDLNGNKILALPCEIGIACSDETTALTTGTAKATFRMPYAMTLTAVRASLTGAGSTSGTTTIDINESGTTVLSTKLTIDAGEKTSQTAATPAVISDSALADDAEITIDIDAVTGGADETGLKVWLIGTRA